MWWNVLASRCGVVAGLATAFLSLSAHAEVDGFAVESDLPPQEIYGGKKVGTCGWPTTVSLGGCTGTLVHPEVVIYAAHCGSGVGSIFLGEEDDYYGSGGRTVYTDFCRTYPGGGPGYGTDWAFCRLSEPVTDVAIVPPLMGCEAAVLTGGREVVAVGFGSTESGDFGVKYEVWMDFNYIEGGEAYIGGGGKDTCQGDSGGPVYVRLSQAWGGDDTWRVFGITSYGNGCGGGGWYSMMHTGMDWFESESGVDLTPCHDADGTWNPGPECKEFPIAPNVGAGSWQSSCAPGPLGTWSGICGAPHHTEPDEAGPTVEIVAPSDGGMFESDPDTGKARMTIVVDAVDDGWGVREVQLLVNGQAANDGLDNTPPYQFTAGFPSGVYELSAVAVDHADNSSEASAIRIGVDMEPPSGAPGGETGTDEDDGGEVGGGFTTIDPELSPGQPAGCACRSTLEISWWWVLILLGVRRLR